MKKSNKYSPFSVFFFVICILLIPWMISQPCLADKAITIAEGPSPENLDPHIDTTQALMNITNSICEPLGYYFFSTNTFKPNLAESWKMLDANTWEFKLRKNVTFTNGEPFNAESVKFSMERIRDPKLKARTAFLISNIKELKIIDPHTIQFITKSPSLSMLHMIFKLGMVPPKYIKEVGFIEFGKNPIGTGPFMLSKWVKDEFVELKANDNYWNGRPKLDRVIFKSIPETVTRMAALRTGEADIVSNVMIEEIPTIKKNEKLDIIEIPSTRTLWAQFNMKQDSPLRDARVRRAMNHAVDVDSIIKNVLQGYGNRLDGQVLVKEYDGFNPNVKAFPYDPEKARQLIKEAGCEDYVFTLNAPTGRYLRDKEIAEVVGSQLNAAGIKTKVRIMEYGALMAQLWSPKKFKDLALWGVATPPTAEVFFGAIIKETSACSTYVNAEFNNIYKEAVATIDHDEQKQLFQKLGKISRDDPIALYLHQQTTIYGVNKRVGGFEPSPDEWIYPYPMFAK